MINLEMSLCESCVCRPVCAIYRATGGMPKCPHHHQCVETKERDERKPVQWELIKVWDAKWHGFWYKWRCPKCGHVTPIDMTTKNFCPNCGWPMLCTEEIEENETCSD